MAFFNLLTGALEPIDSKIFFKGEEITYLTSPKPQIELSRFGVIRLPSEQAR